MKTPDSYHIEYKSWGKEEWIVNNDEYCCKKLYFTVDNGSTSLHFHVKKLETMYVEKGKFCIEIVDTKLGKLKKNILYVGDSIDIERNVPHRIINLENPSILLETSTHHENDDSYRICL